MNTYKEQLQELQEYAFNVLREYPLDKTAANVIAALGNANNQDRIEFFKLNKDEEIVKVFYGLAESGTIEKWLETYDFLYYANR